MNYYFLTINIKLNFKNLQLELNRDKYATIKVHKSLTRKKAELKGFVENTSEDEDTVEPKLIPFEDESTQTIEPIPTEVPIALIEENYSEFKQADDDIQDIINQVSWFDLSYTENE